MWRLGSVGNQGSAWNPETEFGHGHFCGHHSIVLSHARNSCLETSLPGTRVHSETRKNNVNSSFLSCLAWILSDSSHLTHLFTWRPPILPPLSFTSTGLGRNHNILIVLMATSICPVLSPKPTLPSETLSLYSMLKCACDFC